MLSEARSLKVVKAYSQRTIPIKLGCPWCKIDTTYKSKTYKSIKSLLFHISQEHNNQNSYYPFSVQDIRELMNQIVIARDLRLLV